MRPKCTADWLAVPMILAVVATVWISSMREGFSDPVGYQGGDGMQILAWIKGASEGCFTPLCDRTNPRLGFPFGGNWNDFPQYEGLTIWMLGLVARWSNIWTAAHCAELLGHLLSTVGFYAACRLLRWRWDVSAALACVWALSYLHIVRGLGHVFVAYDYGVPLGLAYCGLLMSEGFSKRTAAVGLVAAIIFGQGSAYNACMWLQFAALATLVRRDWKAGFAMAGATGVACLLAHANLFANAMRHGFNRGAIPISYGQTELYAMKPLEMLLPPPWHRAWGSVSSVYESLACVKGEMHANYLGVIGLAALGWLAWRHLRSIWRGQAPSLHLYGVGWIILFSTIGGANCLLALGGIKLWRATNRFSVWILAIALLFFAGQLSRFSAKWTHGWRTLALSVLVGVAIWDQFVPPPEPAAKFCYAADVEFWRSIEAQLPPKAAVLVLPPQNFPESYPVGGCEANETLRPYLASKNLRFSNGRIIGRQTEDDLVRTIVNGDPTQVVERAKSAGFSALCLFTKAFQNAHEIIQAFSRVHGVRVIGNASGDQVVLGVQ